MRLRIATVTTLASVPLGVAVGFWMTVLTEPTCIIHLDPRGGGTMCPRPALTQPRFSWWMCALIGGATAVALFGISRLVRMPPSSRARWTVASALRVLSPAVGVGVGIGMAQFVSFCNIDPMPTPGPHVCAWQTTFPLWSLILFGVAAVAVVLLVAKAVQPHTPHNLSQGSMARSAP
jgi:hypothetical protein